MRFSKREKSANERYHPENDWGPAKLNITQVGNLTKAPYKYSLTPLSKVEEAVKAGAGLNKIKLPVASK